MAKPTRTTDRPAPKQKTVDLTRCKIPGGEARFFTADQLSNRRRRMLAVYDITLMPKLRRLMVAQHIIDDEGNRLTEDGPGSMVEGLSKDEAKDLIEMNDAAAWVYLKSWTLRRADAPLALPEDLDDLLDNYPSDVVDALVGHAAKIVAQTVADNTDADALFDARSREDEESPSTA